MKAIIIVAIFVFVANMQQVKLEVIFSVLTFCCKYAELGSTAVQVTRYVTGVTFCNE